MPANRDFPLPSRAYRRDGTPAASGPRQAILRVGAAAAVVLLLTGCSTQASLSIAAAPASESATASPAAKAAADKAAADKAAADQAAAAKAAAEKAAAEKAAADKDAADRAVADKAAAEAAARQAAETKAAQDAAAVKAAAEAAAKAAAPPAPAAQPVPGTNPGCDPNYSGCVPIASDVDCAGGSGNGPAYVRGPVQVIGRDIYGLDADHDGVGCER